MNSKRPYFDTPSAWSWSRAHLRFDFHKDLLLLKGIKHAHGYDVQNSHPPDEEQRLIHEPPHHVHYLVPSVNQEIQSVLFLVYN